MGCWNETCAVTQLPIFHGEEVAWFPLVENAFYQGGTETYHTSIHAPITLPVMAKYDDYGGIENIKEDWNSKLLLDVANREIDFSTGNNGDIRVGAAKFPLDNIETLSRYIDASKMKVVAYVKTLPTEVRTSHMMVHKYMYDFMVKRRIRTFRGYVTKEAVIKDLHKAAELYKKRLLPFFSFSDFIHYPSKIPSFSEPIGVSYSIRDIFRPLENAIVSGSSYENIIESIAEFIMFDSNLARMRKHYAPQTGAGSQGDESLLTAAMMAEARRFVRIRNKELE